MRMGHAAPTRIDPCRSNWPYRPSAATAQVRRLISCGLASCHVPRVRASVVFLAVVASKRISAEVTSQSEFFCLCCNAERSYGQRRWQETWHLFRFWPVGGAHGEFVICLTCGSTYDSECLDETSIAELDELLVDPPYAVTEVAVTEVAGLRPRRNSGARTARTSPEEQLSGYSPARRH